MYTLRLLGGVSLVGPSGTVAGRAVQRRQLALLALLGVSGEEGLSRDKLLGYLWPESSEDRARHLLRDSIYLLRKALAEDAILTAGDIVRLNAAVVGTDVAAFQAAVARGALEEAVAAYGGSFLDGFYLREVPDFERWVESTRRGLAVEHQEAVESMAREAERAGDYPRAVGWWRRLVAQDPYNSRFAIGLMQALVAAGDPANAIQHAEEHERVLRDDLGVGAPPELLNLVTRLRSEAGVHKVAFPPRARVPAGTRVAADRRPIPPVPPPPTEKVQSAAPPTEGFAPAARRRRARLAVVAGALAAAGLAGWIVLRAGADGREPGGTLGTVRQLTSFLGNTYAPTWNPDGAEVGPGLAVLPFRVVGPDRDVWREGMVDLLSTNLDGVAGIRKVDPRSVLHRWRSDIGEGREAPDEQAALRVASGVGARYAVMGSVVGSAAEVRLSADVYDVGTGKRLGMAQVEGSPDSIMGLVDRLSVQLLRAGLASGIADVRRLHLSQVTTTSLPALKAYLAGERDYQRNRFREAIPHFTRAVDADSTFALALHRLNAAHSWTSGFPSRALQYSRRAARLAGRLPRREALLVRGSVEWQEGWLVGIESLERLTTEYPDYPEGWYELGEAYYHIGDQGLHAREKFRHALRRALELNPDLGPAYIHLIDEAFLRVDSADARELIARYDRLDPGSAWTVGYRLAYALAWGDSVSRARSLAALDTAQTDVLMGPTSPLNFGGGDFWREQLRLSEALTDTRHPPGARYYGWEGRINAYLQRGRVRLARQAADSIAAAVGEEFYNVAVASRSHVALYLAGLTDSTGVRRAEVVLGSDPGPWDRLLLGAVAAKQRRWGDLEREVEALELRAQGAEVDGDSARTERAYAAALSAYAALQRGEDAVEGLQEALAELPGMGPRWIATGIHRLLRYEVGRALLEAGKPREAQRYLESVTCCGATRAPGHFYLGQTYEDLGDVEKARVQYARFVRWWEDCDPALRPLWEQGRKALERLTADPQRP